MMYFRLNQREYIHRGFPIQTYNGNAVAVFVAEPQSIYILFGFEIHQLEVRLAVGTYEEVHGKVLGSIASFSAIIS